MGPGWHSPPAQGVPADVSVIHKLGVSCTCAVGVCREMIAAFAPGFQLQNLPKLSDFFGIYLGDITP